jgi:hypothetical protein
MKRLSVRFVAPDKENAAHAPTIPAAAPALRLPTVSETLTPEAATAPAGVAPVGEALSVAPARPRIAARRRALPVAVTAPLAPVALALAGVLLFALLDPHPVDLAAGTYRADLFAREGFTVWNAQWYGGHHTAPYSVLFPPLAALLGPAVLGAIAALASAALFEALTRRWAGGAAKAGAAWFGLGTGTLLFTGRMPFALGVAIGLGALLALQRDRVPLAVALAAACSLASPVAGLFVALAATAHAIAAYRAAPAAVAGAALAPPLTLAVVFPSSGEQFFSFTELYWLLFTAAALYALVGPRERTLRIGAALYALAGVAAFVAPTPLGNNITRLGPLVAGPLIACVLVRRDGARGLRRPLALACLSLLAFSLFWPAWEDYRKVSGDPAAQRSYYEPLTAFLAAQGGPPGRVEIPFTRAHWEAATVAERFPLARGWERQLELRRNPLFYGAAPLDARTYRRWLADNGVRWVAVPDAALDFSAYAERRLIDGGLPYLKLRARLPHWRVYENTGPRGLVVPETGARIAVRSLTPRGLRLAVERPGAALVRVRWTPYWRVPGACVARAPGGWTKVTATRTGELSMSARFSLERVIRRGRRCAAE